MILQLAVCLLMILSAPAHAGWIVQNSGTTRNLHSVTGNHGNNDEAWACGEAGVIVYTSDGGVTWTMQDSGTMHSLYGIVFLETAGSPLVAVGENGTILRTTNRGITWTPVQSGTTAHLYGVSDFHTHAVGDSGIVLRTPDHGITWVRIPAVTSKRLRSVSTSFTGSACGDSGIILRRFSAISDIWNIMPTGTTADLFGIPMFANSNFVVGDSGLILRSSDAGASWYTQTSCTVARLRHAQFSTGTAGRIYCVGDSGIVLKTTDGGATWGRQQSGTVRNLNSVFFYLSDNFGWAAGDSGTIVRTTDGGGPVTGVEASDARPVAAILLSQNFPNPFNPATTIEFLLSREEFVTLTIFNILGRQLETLLSERLSPGIHAVRWHAHGLPGGVYFYRLQGGSFRETRKLMLLH